MWRDGARLESGAAILPACVAARNRDRDAPGTGRRAEAVVGARPYLPPGGAAVRDESRVDVPRAFEIVRRLLRRLALTREERAWLRRIEAERGALPDPRGEEVAARPLDLPLDAERQCAFLRSLAEEPYPTLFRRLRSDAAIDPSSAAERAGRGDLIQNGYFPSPDAELYGAMIVAHRPTRVVEVGAGYSTAVARATIEHLGADTALHVIDPQPRRSVVGLADRVERCRVERSSLASESVEAGTLLFIDSSHLVRPGGDGPFLYCRLLPSLPPGVLVHVHDVFLPFDYPRVYQERGYAEQYLLHALLSAGGRFEVLFATYFMSAERGEAMRRAFGPGVASGDFRGASFWMRSVRGRPREPSGSRGLEGTNRRPVSRS